MGEFSLRLRAALCPRKDESVEGGDLSEHRQPPPHVHVSQTDPSKSSRRNSLKMRKKGKMLMVLVTISDDPTEKVMEEISSLWQRSLFSANFNIQRFVVPSSHVIFMLRDRNYTWEIKDFSVDQEWCADVTVESQVFPKRSAEKHGKKQKSRSERKTAKRKPAKNRNCDFLFINSVLL
ncbi:LOW QUALITY PROTEIN: LRP chaperone MESD [Scleropages formosus]|uniref:LOW QUALITY PROTEIN: LRP chaperone MESD n=1 Tax=Scleropages formosus TaxID=113540 RepID=UPI003D935CF0